MIASDVNVKGKTCIVAKDKDQVQIDTFLAVGEYQRNVETKTVTREEYEALKEVFEESTESDSLHAAVSSGITFTFNVPHGYDIDTYHITIKGTEVSFYKNGKEMNKEDVEPIVGFRLFSKCLTGHEVKEDYIDSSKVGE